MDISQEALEAADSQSDDSTISEEVNQLYRRRSEALGFLHSVRLAYGADSKEYVEFSYLMHEYENERDKSTVTREKVIEKFIQPVEEAFGAGSLEYAEFLELMFDFVDKRADIQVVRSRIRLLFKEHPQLVVSFDTYFPAEVQAQKDRPLIQAVVDAESVRFLNNIRMAYMHDEGCYKAYLDIVCGHQSANNDIHDLYKEVCILFHDRPDLIATFRKFLPVS